MEMMLSKNYDEKKVQFPCYVSRKYDGVPVIIYMDGAELKFKSRQGNDIQSIQHIRHAFDVVEDRLLAHGIIDQFICVGELIIPNKPFKYISGKVRKNAQCPELELMVFEAAIDFFEIVNPKIIKEVTQYHIDNQVQLDEFISKYPEHWEGIMIRHGEYQHGKRSWNSMKFKREPTVDLKVLGVEEAYSKDGEPKGMIGAFICEFHGRSIKVNAGKMNHPDRKDLWENPPEYGERIIEVKYMKDDSYDDLRQPTFQRWRDDKNEVNEEV